MGHEKCCVLVHCFASVSFRINDWKWRFGSESICHIRTTTGAEQYTWPLSGGPIKSKLIKTTWHVIPPKYYKRYKAIWRRSTLNVPSLVLMICGRKTVCANRQLQMNIWRLHVAAVRSQPMRRRHVRLLQTLFWWAVLSIGTDTRHLEPSLPSAGCNKLRGGPPHSHTDVGKSWGAIDNV